MNTTKKEKYIPLFTKVIEVHGELGFCETAAEDPQESKVAVRRWYNGLENSDEPSTLSSRKRGW